MERLTGPPKSVRDRSEMLDHKAEILEVLKNMDASSRLERLFRDECDKDLYGPPILSTVRRPADRIAYDQPSVKGD
jgi:hypothetical protein